MKRILIISAILFGGIVIAQQKKNAFNNWKSRDRDIAQKVFSKYQEKENKKSDDEKADLIKNQRKLKIEILNEGNIEKYNQFVWLCIVKVNNRNLEQIVDTRDKDISKDISVVKNTMGANNWKDEAGGFNFKNIADLTKISQEFISNKNEEGVSKSSLKPIEIYETTEPVLNFSLKIYTHKNSSESASLFDLNKTINIYADDKLIKTLRYSLKELRKVEGVSIREFTLHNNENK